MYMGEGVNFTAGLPFVRTSPDHGTAYELAGKNKADESSLRQAVYTAVDIVKQRAQEAAFAANPLVIDEKMFADKKKNRENA